MEPILAYQTHLQTALNLFLEEKERHSSGWSKDFTRRLRPFAISGKLLRGSLVCYSYSMFSGSQPTDEVVHTAVAIELTHAALLIHDDIMDQDDIRRGQPSFHHQYRLLATRQKLADAHHFGESMAICAGDAALFFAFDLLSQVSSDIITFRAVNSLFAQALAEVCMGQMQDVYLEAQADMPSKKDIYHVMEAKTASYSIALPLTMGAILAKQSTKTVKTLHDFGMAAGTIFQIRDDELGALGNANKLGKPVGSDITEGKKTLIYYYLLKRCTAAECTQLKNIFGNAHAQKKDIAEVQKLINKYAIPQLLNHEISTLKNRAYKHIDALPVSGNKKLELQALVEFCACRQS